MKAALALACVSALVCGVSARSSSHATSTRNVVRGVPTGETFPIQNGDASLPFTLSSGNHEGMNRPEVINYNPVANVSAVVFSSDSMARFTVLAPRVIRMEYAKNASQFEDHSTLAIMNRNTPVPFFTSSETGGVLQISTDEVTVSYKVGSPFSASTLTVTSKNASSAFTSWSYGDAFPGNLLGTIRGLDGQGNTPLNCTTNVNITDNVSIREGEREGRGGL